MPYNSELKERIEDIVIEWDGIEMKKMFGGICYLVNGNMCFGIYKDYIIVRMAVDQAKENLKNKSVREFDITGRPIKGWVMVGRDAYKNKNQLRDWLNIGRSYALTLPEKLSRKKSLEEIYYRNRR